MWNIHQRLELRPGQQGYGALGDIDREIAHPFEIAVDLDGCGEEPQVARHRLMQREQSGGEFVDLDIELVDALFGLPDIDHQGIVAIYKRADTVVDRRLDQTAHLENFVL